MQIRLINKGSLDTVSGGYIYNKEVFEGLQKRGYSISYTDQFARKEDSIDIVDSLVVADYMHHHSDLNRTLVLIHELPDNLNPSHPNFQQLQFIVTGGFVKNELIEKWKTAPQNITLIEPGIEANWQIKRHHNSKPKNILMVGNYVPRKQYDLLPPILEKIKDLNWNLKAYGSPDFAPNYFYQVKEQIKKTSFGSKVELNLPLNRTALNQAYINADVFLHCAERETYGMAVAEAIQSQLPCIIYRTGDWEAFEATGWVKVVHSLNAEAFAATLRHFFLHPESFSDKPASVKNDLMRTWENVVEDFEEVISNF